MTKILSKREEARYAASIRDLTVADLVQETLDVLHGATAYFGPNDQRARLCLAEFQRRAIPEVYDKTHKLFYAEAKQGIAVAAASEALFTAIAGALA
jgi:hypothetical protein